MFRSIATGCPMLHEIAKITKSKKLKQNDTLEEMVKPRTLPVTRGS